MDHSVDKLYTLVLDALRCTIFLLLQYLYSWKIFLANIYVMGIQNTISPILTLTFPPSTLPHSTFFSPLPPPTLQAQILNYQLYFCMTTLSSRPLQCNQVVFCSYKIKWWQWSPYIPHHHECLHITKSNLDISMLSTCQPHVFSMYQALLYNRCQSFLLLSITMLFLLLVYYLVQWSMMHGLFIIMGGDHLFECISKKTCSSNGRI